MDKHKITYHLEGGTLLGLVRDGDLLPWDHDVDISINSDQLEKFQKYCHELKSLNYKLSKKDFSGTHKALLNGSPRIYKVKPRLASLLKEFSFFFHNQCINIDIFIKYSDHKYTYWQAADNALKASKHHYEGFGEIEFMGQKLKIPLDHEGYLESKYGDWHIPVKVWDCGKDEKTICTKMPKK